MDMATPTIPDGQNTKERKPKDTPVMIRFMYHTSEIDTPEDKTGHCKVVQHL